MDATAPARKDVDAPAGATVLEFGASWCPICQSKRSLIDHAFASRPGVQHFWIEDAKDNALCHSFGIKLLPTLVFLLDGQEVARVVRPQSSAELSEAFGHLV